MKWRQFFLSSLIIPGFFISCSNSGSFGLKSPSPPPVIDSLTATSGAQTNLKISSVKVETLNEGQIQTFRIVASFNLVNNKVRPISDYCFGSSGGPSLKPCDCRFSWSEKNTTAQPYTTIARQVTSPIMLVQPGLISCTTPPVITTDVEDGNTIHLSIMPNFNNPEKFSPISSDFIKGNKIQTGDFVDADGNGFFNILRYTCFEQKRRGLSIKNKIETVTDPQGIDKTIMSFPLSNRFCVTKSDGTITENCSDNLKEIGYSSRSNYYNLYIRTTELGSSLSPGNPNFVCPTVQVHEALNPVSRISSSYWPLDTTFALSLRRNPNFNVGIVANSTTNGEQGDFSQIAAGCNISTSSATASQGSSGSLVQSCLGFAARPNADGTCPSFQGSGGKVLKTFRLRRFLALYPPDFDTSGYALKQSQSTDTIYVLDRPVVGPNAQVQYTMLGAKPCPYAYFDHKRATSVHLNYRATSSAAWAGKNVDGIQLPNEDYYFNVDVNSCAATIPVLNAPFNTVFTLATSHSTNVGKLSYDKFHTSFQRVFIRPVKPWAPHYEEDTGFLACAPLSNPLQDPPLHFAKDPDTGNVSYCAEVYPTQNDNIAKINSTGDSEVLPYTSHFVKNTTGGDCNHTVLKPPTNRQPTGYERHDSNILAPETERNTAINNILPNYSQTCDRTVVNTDGPAWSNFPLLAPSAAIESAIIADKSFQCAITFDENKGKAFAKETPAQGCCGSSVRVWTKPDDLVNTAQTAHLEPRPSNICQPPVYSN